MQSLTGHKLGIIRSEKHCGTGDFLRASHAPERNCSRRFGEFLLAAAVTRLSRVGQPRRNRIDPDPDGASSKAIARVIDSTPPLLAT